MLPEVSELFYTLHLNKEKRKNTTFPSCKMHIFYFVLTCSCDCLNACLNLVFVSYSVLYCFSSPLPPSVTSSKCNLSKGLSKILKKICCCVLYSAIISIKSPFFSIHPSWRYGKEGSKPQDVHKDSVCNGGIAMLRSHTTT